MASRTRIRNFQSGGEVCGQRDSGPAHTPAFLCPHICIDETHPGPPYKSGGPFSVVKKIVHIERLPYFELTWNYGASLYYKGYMYVEPYNIGQPAPLSLTGWGAKAFQRAIPTHPIYNLGVSIGELKDLPGMVSQTLRGFQALSKAPEAIAKAFKTVSGFMSAGSKLPGTVGHSYLYGAFGLYPMLQDLFFLLEMQEKLNKKINWLRRHNNKSVRRKFTMQEQGFSEDISRNVPTYSTVGPGLNGACYPSAGNIGNQPFPIRKTYSNKIWFSGKFRYYIPELVKRSLGPMRGLKSHLLGLAPDPSIIYKLIPWSWLLDWFTSVGAALSNVYQMARYGVVAEYAYIMCRETFDYAAPGKIYVNVGDYGDFIGRGAVYHPQAFSGTSHTRYEFRTREVANPYGFGITWPSLSAFQWSILVALGLTGLSGTKVRVR